MHHAWLRPVGRYHSATLHPATLVSRQEAEKEAEIFFDVLEDYADANIVVTYPNSDKNNTIIIRRIRKLARRRNVRAFRNLGDLRYLSLMKACGAVVGNSSSGLVDLPFLRIPCVDYGDSPTGEAGRCQHHPCRGRRQQAQESDRYGALRQELYRHSKQS